MKRISPATVTLGVLALVFGLVAAYIVRVSFERPIVAEKPAPTPPVDRGVPVVTAKWNLPLHHRIGVDDTSVVFVPRKSPYLKTAVANQALVIGRITTKTIKAGQMIVEGDLLGIGEGLPTLSERIPVGHRALTISVDRTPAGGKKIEEGAFVDVALTIEGTHPDIGGVSTKTLLHRVLVVDPNAGPSGASRSAANRQSQVNVDNITLAVSPADANKLITAEKAGRLSVTLCSKKEESLAAADDAITKEELLGLREIAPPPAPPAAVPARQFVVERWSGGQMTLLHMTNDRVRESREVSAGGGKKTRQFEDVEFNEALHKNADELPQIVNEGEPRR